MRLFQAPRLNSPGSGFAKGRSHATDLAKKTTCQISPAILASKIALLASKTAFLASKIVFLASKVDILANFWPPKSNFNFQLRIFVDLGSILKCKTLENINFP